MMGWGKKKTKTKMKNSTSGREATRTMPVPIMQVQEKSSKSIGCMSGIFQFLAHHRHSPRRLPSAAGRREKIAKETAPLPEQKTPTLTLPERDRETMHLIIPDKTFCLKQTRRRACNVQRSPTLPSEIRRSSAGFSQLDSPRRPTPLVVRLMGLDEVPMTSSPRINTDEVEQKRRKLLGALEKCDEDLKSLKKIIDAVRVANSRKEEAKVVGRFISAGSDMVQDGESSLGTLKNADGSTNGEQPSPISVLDVISSPKYRSNGPDDEKRKESPMTAIQSRPSKPGAFPCTSGSHGKNNMETKECHPSILHQTTVEMLPRMSKWKEAELSEDCRWAKWAIKGDYSRRRGRNDALVENVGEVCEYGIWEQRREFGSIVVGLERGIVGDLVDEFVKELLGVYFKVLISQGTWRKRLCF